jgi:hypothetical protein
VLAGYHLAIGIRRTDAIEPADPQQNPGDNINLPADEPAVTKPFAIGIGACTTPKLSNWRSRSMLRASRTECPVLVLLRGIARVRLADDIFRASGLTGLRSLTQAQIMPGRGRSGSARSDRARGRNR